MTTNHTTEFNKFILLGATSSVVIGHRLSFPASQDTTLARASLMTVKEHPLYIWTNIIEFISKEKLI